jgi:hypothetical protein
MKEITLILLLNLNEISNISSLKMVFPILFSKAFQGKGVYFFSSRIGGIAGIVAQ